MKKLNKNKMRSLFLKLLVHRILKIVKRNKKLVKIQEKVKRRVLCLKNLIKFKLKALRIYKYHMMSYSKNIVKINRNKSIMKIRI